MTKRAKPLRKRICFAANTFAKEYIFVSGGEYKKNALKKVEYFSIRNNKWAKAPELNV